MRVGDKVKYRGKDYYIVGGPTDSGEGPAFELSAVPPTFFVAVSELEKVDSGMRPMTVAEVDAHLDKQVEITLMDGSKQVGRLRSGATDLAAYALEWPARNAREGVRQQSLPHVSHFRSIRDLP